MPRRALLGSHFQVRAVNGEIVVEASVARLVAKEEDLAYGDVA